MDTPFHPLSDLFKQLGLPSRPAEIEAWILSHRPQAQGCALPEAPVWSPAQADFLRQAVADDADWALPAEALSERLCR